MAIRVPQEQLVQNEKENGTFGVRDLDNCQHFLEDIGSLLEGGYIRRCTVWDFLDNCQRCVGA